MPQAARLNWSHCWAFNSSGGKLVTRATVSGRCWRRWRRSRAICSTQGKSTDSPVAGWERSTRSSGWPLLNSRWPASVGLACRGGKIHRRGGNEFFDVLLDGGLIVFDRQQEISAMFQDGVPGGLVLGMESVQADFAAVQVQFVEQLPGDGDFVGLGVHQGAAQVMLAGNGDGGEHGMAAALARLFAVQDDEILNWSRPANLFLGLEKKLFQFVGVEVLHHAAKGRLAGSRVAV